MIVTLWLAVVMVSDTCTVTDKLAGPFGAPLMVALEVLAANVRFAGKVPTNKNA